MKKEIYASPVTELIDFETEDVITTSSTEIPIVKEKVIELPFVPADTEDEF